MRTDGGTGRSKASEGESLYGGACGVLHGTASQNGITYGETGIDFRSDGACL